MQEQARRIRAAVEQCNRTRSTEPFPVGVRAAAVAFVHQARSNRWKWHDICEAIGISENALRRWIEADQLHDQDHQQGALVPVTVGHEAPALRPECLVLVSPTGFRLEGLALDQAAQLLSVL